jgi:DNA-dependent protein kinase catalytic subunit
MYEDFLMKQRGSSYNSKVASPSSQDTTTNFRSAQEKIPGDLLRRQYLAMGADPQDFVYLRDSFSKSLAVFNTCSYILGIGDRHLDNFLVSHEDGSVIGIDFGVSFGAGASVLPVPELIPFRFTRQMETVFHPYDGINLQMQDMGLVLDALREKRQVIESVMNVFLHEPLLDWQKSITTHQIEIFDQQEIEVLEEETAVNSRSRKPKQKATVWLPDVKIAIARRKLEGFSPRTLLKEELAQNPHLGSQLGKFKEFVEGAKYEEKIVRVIKEEEEAVGPSSYQGKYYGPFEQAKELLVLATDPNVLGRTYHGWMPWL